MINYEKLKSPTEETIQKIEENYKIAISNLNSKFMLRDFNWQKELVIYLAYLIHHLRKRIILILLGTGHGKSVVI